MNLSALAIEKSAVTIEKSAFAMNLSYLRAQAIVFACFFLAIKD